MFRRAPYINPMFEQVPKTLDFSSGFTGRMIVAMPHLADTPFAESVCLICSHSEDHAFGVIVNKPMQELDLGDVVDELGIQCAPSRADTPVFFGGPVDLQRGAVLHSLDYRQDDTMLITPSLGLTASRDALRTLCQNGDDAPRQAVLVMGHAGWTAGQLDEEVKRNDWLTIDAMPGLVFGASSDAWSGALHQLGITDLTRLDGRERFAPLPH